MPLSISSIPSSTRPTETKVLSGADQSFGVRPMTSALSDFRLAACYSHIAQPLVPPGLPLQSELAGGVAGLHNLPCFSWQSVLQCELRHLQILRRSFSVP